MRLINIASICCILTGIQNANAFGFASNIRSTSRAISISPAFPLITSPIGTRSTELGPSVLVDNLSITPEEWLAKQRVAFRALVLEVMEVEQRELLPSLLTRSIDMLVDLRGAEGVQLCRELIAEAEASGNEEYAEKAHAAVQYIVFFVETFVVEAKKLDDEYKFVLGKILRLIAPSVPEPGQPAGMSVAEREIALDGAMERKKQYLTPGFLRHLDGECTRIASQKNVNVQSARLIELLRIIQLRIVEELGKDLGEGAQVLGQLLGYETSNERIAVLDAGLRVRGVEYAAHLKVMTAEALEGFQNVPNGADPNLVVIVTEIDNHLQGFIAHHS